MCTCRPVLDIRNEVGQDFDLKSWDRDRERGCLLSLASGTLIIKFAFHISKILIGKENQQYLGHVQSFKIYTNCFFFISQFFQFSILTWTQRRLVGGETPQVNHQRPCHADQGGGGMLCREVKTVDHGASQLLCFLFFFLVHFPG